MREKYESLSLAVLKELAKARGMRGVSTFKKSRLIEAMLEQDEKDRQSENAGTLRQAGNGAEAHQPEHGNTAEPRDYDGAVRERAAWRAESGEAAPQTETKGAAGPGEGSKAAPQAAGVQAEQNPRRRSTGVRQPQGSRRTAGRDYPNGSAQQEQGAFSESATEYRGTPARQRQMRPASDEAHVRKTGADGSDTRQRPENIDRPPAELSQLDSGQTVSGILEVMSDGYGFIRSANYLPGDNDVYVSPSQIRRFNLKTGDIICGNTRIKSQQEKFSALLYLKTINDKTPSESMKRWNFEDMTPVFPNERMRMERGSRALAMRIVDLFSPIGKGQRGMIVSPPKAGKTTLLKDIARSILENDPNMKLLILLIDERPEEVTDIKEAICGENVEVIYSTFDELPEHHKRVSEMVIERAKRLVEQNEDVTILLDSITRLARAYNLTVPPSGRTLSGGLDPAALHMPKRFFGAARKMREGGSLTILATALVDTGSKMDDVVYEEFKGTGNMELVLDRKLSEKRVFPAIDIPKSGTRREDLLLDRDEQEAMYIMRRALNGMKSDEAVENILNTFVHTRDNHELVQRVRRQKYV